MTRLCLLMIGFTLMLTTHCAAAPIWKDIKGQWQLGGSGAQLTQATDAWAYAARQGLRGDLTIEADLDWRPTGKSAQVGFVLGYLNPDNYAICVLSKAPYKAWNGPTEEDHYTISYYLMANGNETLSNVCPWQYPKDGKHHFKVVIADKQFLASLDGKPVLQGGVFPQLYNGTVGVVARNVTASFSNIKIAATPFGTRLYGMGNVPHDRNGNVLPRWPYKDMITRPCEFVFWAADNAYGNWIRDEQGKKWPPYVYACTINLNGTTGNPTNYIPQEFSFYNNGFLAYYMFTGDKRGLDRAEQLADWLLFEAHVIPPDWPGGKLSITKVSLGKVVGDVDGKNISFWPYGEVGSVDDKDLGGNLISMEEQGAVAISIIQLYHLTGKTKYLDYCKGIADGLLRLQKPEGNWDYRINPRTGKGNDDFTANVIDNIWFLDEMAASTGNRAYSTAARRAEKWFVDVPCKNNRWLNIFGDVPSNVNLEWCKYKGPETENFSYYVPARGIRQLLKNADKNPANLKTAESMRKWIYKNFAAKDCNGERGIAEQTVCYIVMPYHGYNMSMVEADLYEATGKAEHKKMAFHYLNNGMYYAEQNGFILLMGGGTVQATGDMWWCNNMWAPFAYVYTMGTWPEMAPKGENHLVRVSAPLTSIDYSPNGVLYGTARASTDRLVVAAHPKSVKCNGKLLPEVQTLGKGAGWLYSTSGLLKINHPAGTLEVVIDK
ncbi:MAG: hypothetical protein WCL39_04965 [Armatimonadota bacterium]